MQFYINLNSTNNFVRFTKATNSTEPDGRLETPRPAPSSSRPLSAPLTSLVVSNKKKLGQGLRVARGVRQEQVTPIGNGAQLCEAGAKLNDASNQLKMASANATDKYERQHHDNRRELDAESWRRQPADTRDKLDSDRAPASQRPFDVIIFAASGSVGRFLVEEMALVVNKHYSSDGSVMSQTVSSVSNGLVGNSSQAIRKQFAQLSAPTSPLRRRSVPSSSGARTNVNWAIAGRSAVRLSETLCQAELSTGVNDLSTSIPIILADLNHQRSLLEMCKKTSIVINCAGPYSELGAELLIEACLESTTNYIDLSNETTLVERINVKYCERARSRGVFILNGCGFQSMSAEMGLNFTKQVADGRIEQVKIILSLSDTKLIMRRLNSKTSGLVSEGMWNSLLTEKAQEVSVEDRLKRRAASPTLARPSNNYQLQDVHQFNEETSKLMQSTLAHDNHNDDDDDDDDGNGCGQNQESDTTMTNELIRRKDTRSLVQDIVQFRNRNAISTLSWPLQFVRNFQSQSGRGYCWPIDNLTSDESQLIRGEMNNYEVRRPDSDGWRPIRCTTFVSVKHFTHLCLLSIWLFAFEIVVKFSLARFIMRKLPGLVSLGHVAAGANSNNSSRWFSSDSAGGFLMANGRQPNQRQQLVDRDSLNHIKYCQTFIAYGTPGDDSGDPLEDRRRRRTCQHAQVQLLVARLVGPEPNHIATATFCIQAAMTMLMERDHLPGPGGVLTPGAAFAETNIIYQLRRRNIKFEVLKKA